MSTSAPSYAMAYLRDIHFGPELLTYLQRIDSTLEPFGGSFAVHGGGLVPLEGECDGQIVVIRFPSRQAALDWYNSAEYQEILPLRTGNTHSVTAIVDGVHEDYRAADSLAKRSARDETLPD